MFFQKKSKINLSELQPVFEAQKKVLLEKNYQEFEKDMTEAWKRLEQQAENILFVKQGNISLLLVVNSQLEKGIKTIQGHTELNLQNIKQENSNHTVSILLDVEDGAKMVAKSPKDALKKFVKENRFALTINESIALLTHYPALLKKHYVISAGSFYSKENETLPLLWLLDEHGNPELHYAWFHIAHGSYGTPSYKTRI